MPFQKLASVIGMVGAGLSARNQMQDTAFAVQFVPGMPLMLFYLAVSAPPFCAGERVMVSVWWSVQWQPA